MNRNGPLALVFHAAFILFMMLPLALVCLVSFTDKAYLSIPTTWPSLRWYEALSDNPEFLDAFWTSLYVGTGSATIALIISVPAAIALARWVFAGRSGIQAFLMSPLMIPHVVMGIAFLRFFSEIGLAGNFTGLVLSHVIMILPYGLQLAMASASNMDASVEDAAQTLGASRPVVLRRITLPLMLPGIVSGWILAFLHSFDELTMTVFIASPDTTTLPVRLYHHIEETIDPLVTSVSALLIVAAIALIAVIQWLYGLDRLLIGKGRDGPRQ